MYTARRPDAARAACTGGAAAARQRGVTLVEVVLFVLIVGVALSAVLGTLSWASVRSVDPVVQRQAIAIAESMLQEVLSQPFTVNDPDGGPDALGPEPGEARGSSTAPFDHVNDYHGYASSGVTDATGAAVAGLQAYAVAVSVQPQALDGLPAQDGLLVTVTVTGPGGTVVALAGFRARTEP
jgi:MSHA pilin protein MshD